MPNEPRRPSDTPDMAEPPPFGRTWARLYVLVLLNLAVLVVLFYLFKRAFA
ncbi:MAG TPA: hypothetical protein VGV59_01160 [Pyrinomonadaceae bacterium]|nr:hypothetical protein [Pyrinomonadaceae bacterium]